MKNDAVSARRLAFESLVRSQKEKRFANLEINATIEKNALSDVDKSFYTALVYTVFEKEFLLDFLLEKYLKSPVSKLDVEVCAALRLGGAQIFFFDRVPDYSACFETVELVKKSRVRSSAGLVNAVLRSLVRDKEKLKKDIENASLGVKYSVPEWIVDLWREKYGEEKTIEILEGFSKRPPLSLRVNTLKTTSQELLLKLSENGVAAHASSVCDDIIVLDSSYSPTDLYGYEEGLFFVQGTASALAVKALSPKKESLVLDVCACPGGKSFAAAMALCNTGEIHSFDLHESKLSLIEKGAKRLGIDNIFTEAHDAREPFSEFESRADFVIADVPCSGLGVISKKPDIRQKNKADIERLPDIQKRILESAAKALKPGGVLLYSTCTLNPEENECVTNAFLKTCKGFSRRDGFPVTYFPGDVTEDGFFVDIIVKDF